MLEIQPGKEEDEEGDSTTQQKVHTHLPPPSQFPSFLCCTGLNVQQISIKTIKRIIYG